MSSRSTDRLANTVGISTPSSSPTSDLHIERRERGSAATPESELEGLDAAEGRAARDGRAPRSQDHCVTVQLLKVHYGALSLLGGLSSMFFLVGWLSDSPEARSNFFGGGAVCLMSITLAVKAGPAHNGLAWILTSLLVVVGHFALANVPQRQTRASISLPLPAPPAYTVVVARGS